MADLWVQVEVGLPTSKLVDRGRAATGLDADQVMGKLLRLWFAAMSVGCGLTIGERSDAWIEEVVNWRGEPGVFATFVRDAHLDGTAIKDWIDKYGRLEAVRGEAARIKRAQRARLAASRADGPVDSPPDNDVDVHRTEGWTHIPSPSPSPVLDLSLKEKIDLERTEQYTNDPVHQFTEEFDFGDWRPIVQGFIRSSPVPASIMAELRLHCTGAMRYPKSHPQVVGYALNQYLAEQGPMSAGRFKPNLFAGFMRKANDSERVRNAEDNVIVERNAAKEREAEVQDSGQIVARFAVDEPERYVELQAKAEGEVDPTLKMGRSILVRAALVQLVKEELETYAR